MAPASPSHAPGRAVARKEDSGHCGHPRANPHALQRVALCCTTARAASEVPLLLSPVTGYSAEAFRPVPRLHGPIPSPPAHACTVHARAPSPADVCHRATQCITMPPGPPPCCPVLPLLPSLTPYCAVPVSAHAYLSVPLTVTPCRHVSSRTAECFNVMPSGLMRRPVSVPLPPRSTARPTATPCSRQLHWATECYAVQCSVAQRRCVCRRVSQ